MTKASTTIVLALLFGGCISEASPDDADQSSVLDDEDLGSGTDYLSGSDELPPADSPTSGGDTEGGSEYACEESPAIEPPECDATPEWPGCVVVDYPSLSRLSHVHRGRLEGVHGRCHAG